MIFGMISRTMIERRLAHDAGRQYKILLFQAVYFALVNGVCPPTITIAMTSFNAGTHHNQNTDDQRWNTINKNIIRMTIISNLPP